MFSTFRIKQAIEKTKPSPKHNLKDFQLDSIDATNKILPNDIMSGKDVDETNLLLAKDVGLTVKLHSFFVHSFPMITHFCIRNYYKWIRTRKHTRIKSSWAIETERYHRLSMILH